MKVNGKRISQEKFWEDFKAPEIENLEELYEENAERFLNENKYTEDAWCYVQDYEDGILFRCFLIRRKFRYCTRKGERYLKMGDLCCNREVKQVFISRDGSITYRANNYYFKCFEGLIFSNDKGAWTIRRYITSGYQNNLTIAVSTIHYGKIDNAKYVYKIIENHNAKYTTNDKDLFWYDNHLLEDYRKYLSNSLYEISFKMGNFQELPKSKKLTPKIVANAVKFKIVDKLDVMLECNSLDYEAFQKISLYRYNNIKKTLNEDLFKKFIPFMIKYAKNHESFISSIYWDYLENLKTLHIEINEEKALNKNFMKDHERLVERIQETKKEANIKGYKAFVEKNHNFEFLNIINDDTYQVIVPTTLSEYISEAEQNHNCVYKNSYYKKMASKNCLIMFVRKKSDVEKSYVTVELDMQYKVIQCYADHNSNPEQEVKDFVQMVADTYKQKNLFKRIKSLPIEERI